LTNPTLRSKIQRLDRDDLEKAQVARLNRLLAQVLPCNSYYQSKFGCADLQVNSLSEWATVPTSQKSDWLGTDASGLAIHHTFPENQYRRYHRTSGTRGHPMVILDTQADWQWWIETWQYVLDACGIESDDRIMMAFSFGPFIGFWSAHDACLHRGCMVIPCGGMSTAARIDLMLSAKPTVLFSTPSYAMHLAQDAASRSIDLSKSSIRQVFVAGEPGGSIPTIRQRIETMFGAQVMDHAGATEVGPWGFGSADGRALHIIESEFIAEFLPAENQPNSPISLENHESEKGVYELVLTSLGRAGAPVLRYRTGDLVKPTFGGDSRCKFVRLESGVLGRADDMIVVRGVNIFPTSIDAIVRSFPSITHYRLTVSKVGAMDELMMEFESPDTLSLDSKSSELSQLLAEKLSIQLNLRFEVQQVPAGSIPRSEGKARTIFDRR
jgi:phenylacetate-CoA ligase